MHIGHFTCAPKYARHFHSLKLRATLWGGEKGKLRLTMVAFCSQSQRLQWPGRDSASTGPLESALSNSAWSLPEAQGAASDRARRAGGTLCAATCEVAGMLRGPGQVRAEGLSPGDGQHPVAPCGGCLPISMLRTQGPQGAFRGSMNPPDALTCLCPSHSSS